MKHRRFATASWMLVPMMLAAPALISALSLWFNWGPQWPTLAIVFAGALLALTLDHRRALRYGLIGAGVGLITCPLLLLLNQPAWYLFVTWIAIAMVLPALLIPLLPVPARRSSLRYQTRKLMQADSDTLEQLAAIKRHHLD